MSCNRIALTQHLLLFLLVYGVSGYSQVHYYIRPSQAVHCPEDPCPTLAQFTADSTSYLGNETNISLTFLPGNHSLDRELFLSHADNFSMVKDTGGNGTVFVECSSQSGRFNISETTFATIKGLHFIGCGGNSVSQVDQFTLEDTIFHGMEGRGTALVLNEVIARVTKSLFLSNTHGSTFKQNDTSNFATRQAILDYLYLERDPLLAAGGALYTAFSNISIVNSNFTDNTAEIGGALFAHNSSLHDVGSTYSYNTANFGGVMITSESSVNIDNSTFSKNAAMLHHGGVMITYKDSFSISGATFINNSAGGSTGVLFMIETSFSIRDSTFSDNTADLVCGVIYADNGNFNIIRSTFTNNSAPDGCGVIRTIESAFNVISSAFTNNNGAADDGGVICTVESAFNVISSAFTNNGAADDGGVIRTLNSSFNITSSGFTNNTADDLGGVMITLNSSFNITSSTFANNTAGFGGVMMTYRHSSFNITGSTFTNNSAAYHAGVIYTINSSFIIIESSFFANKAAFGGVMSTTESSTYITDCTFDYNSGSLYISNSNLTFSGYTRYENSVESLNNIATSDPFTQPGQEGGAVTGFQSTVIFTGVSSLSHNQARHGGAILATESRILMYGETTIANNIAINGSGGGISLWQSDLDIKGNCIIFGNHAMRGGGIHASGSTVAVYQPWTLQVINNKAENGSGIYLEVNARMYVLKLQISPGNVNYNLLSFTENHANYGGAIYVADDTNSGTCSPYNECFIQTLVLHPLLSNMVNTENIFFSGNTASEQGTNLFGGLLDRCIPSPFAEVYRKQTTYYSGVSYLGNISNLTALDTISSLPVRVCFCKSESEPDCSYQPPNIEVKKGEAFNVSLVAVDQVNHSVDANIISSLSSQDGGFSEGQQIQSVERNQSYCSNLTFIVFSPHPSETIVLFADGPCGSSALSLQHLDIQFTNCTCPVGFESSDSETRCECICDSKLSRYITDCNSTTESLVRVNTNSWITYINDSDPPGYVIHLNCPFDYCRPPTENVSMNLNLPNGADTQCAYNRSEVLCGACQEYLSLSLGSSRCLPCHSHWPAVLTVILLAAIIAGILLVIALLALNMTVAFGLINGFIFYANIVAANSAVYFPSSEPSFPTVFVAWLNLDIGIDVCFLDGLDAYTKTWLQLAFPVYIISLVIILIIVSEYSPRFAGLIGKNDPIATLATLILLSYAKLLLVTIRALSFAVLDYPNGSRETVWLPDGNVKYFQGKHTALVLVALLIILIGVPYTILLFLWQWLVRAPRWKVLKWTRNTKLNAFISVYHAPNNSRYRYWTGLLLLVRVILYIVASVTESNNPQISLLVTIILVGGLVSVSKPAGVTVYKNILVDVVDTILYFNLLALSTFSLYHFKADNTKQTAVAYTSTIITFILLIGVIIYHVSLLVRKNKPTNEDEYSLILIQPQAEEGEVTHSVIELPKPDDQSPSPEVNIDQIEVRELTAESNYHYTA